MAELGGLSGLIPREGIQEAQNKPRLDDPFAGRPFELEIGNDVLELPAGSTAREMMEAITAWHNDPEVSGVDYDPRPMILDTETQQIKPVESSVRDKIFNRAYDFFAGGEPDPQKKQKAQRWAHNVVTALDFTGVGDQADLDEAARAFENDDFLNGAILSATAALGIIPALGDVGAKAIREIPPNTFGKVAQKFDFGDPKLIQGELISQRFPTAKSFQGDPNEAGLLVDIDTLMTNPEQVKKQADLVRTYREAANYRTKNPEATIRNLKDQAVDNYLFMYDQMPPEYRARSMNWYNGANRMANNAAAQYGTTVEGAAGVYASLSPQMDWYKNVSLGNRTMDIMQNQQGTKISPEMKKKAQELFDNPKGGWGKDVKKTWDKMNKDAALGELANPDEKAIFVRLYDEVNNPKSYDVISPEGDLAGKKLTKTGEEAAVSWGSNSTIAKAISAYEDPSIENIGRIVGQQHKVRNFYNNIVAPDKGNSVTSDTHNVAAGHMMPLSGTSQEVIANLGGAASDARTGVRGTYPIYADAIREAAGERGVLPRQMQSITWEGIRGLFPDTLKRDRGFLTKADELAAQRRTGRLDQSGFQEAMFEEAGGISLPSWLTDNPINRTIADE